MSQAWSQEEVEATVADYFRMFELELAGQKVKTTSFGKETPFFLSHTELERSQADAPQYFLYRVFEFRVMPRVFALKGEVDRNCILDPLTYRARFA
jgi:hypothetical protein